MARYSKAIAAVLGTLVGAIVAVVMGWLAQKGFGECKTVGDLGEICTIGNYTQAEVTAWLMGIIMVWLGGHITYAAPPNDPLPKRK